MKLATFSIDHGDTRPGIVIGDEVADLGAVDGAPASVLALLAEPDWVDVAETLGRRALRRPLDEVHLCAPIPHPPKFMAIGLNSKNHRAELNARFLLREPALLRVGLGYAIAHPRSKTPYFFAKATSCITGPYDPIVVPADATKVDWEGELAVVIGARIHDVGVQDAERSIAGYTITNDVTIRDWQMDNPTSTGLAKSYPSHGPMGPWLVPRGDVDVDDLELRTYLNGEQRQRGRVADLIHPPAEVVSRLSRFMALQPGDVVACGTFAGIGWPAGRFLEAGDTVRIEVDGIGHIDNPVVPHGRGASAVPMRSALRSDADS